jgi:CHAD domain-containing protein
LKARKIKELDPDGPLRDNARKIVDVRADELRSFSPAVLDPRNVEALHDMRIAAKRLRYVLELTTPVFGDPAAHGAKRAKKLQDLLGEIHDCDVTIPRVERHIARLRLDDAAALREAAASTRAADLDPKAARDAPNRLLYRGLESLVVYLRARRDVLYGSFVGEWERAPLVVTLDGEEEMHG